MTVISLMMMTSKITLSTTAIATRYSTRYSDFLLLLDSNSTRSKKTLHAGACSEYICFRGLSPGVHRGSKDGGLVSRGWWAWGLDSRIGSQTSSITYFHLFFHSKRSILGDCILWYNCYILAGSVWLSRGRWCLDGPFRIPPPLLPGYIRVAFLTIETLLPENFLSHS